MEKEGYWLRSQRRFLMFRGLLLSIQRDQAQRHRTQLGCLHPSNRFLPTCPIAAEEIRLFDQFLANIVRESVSPDQILSSS
jgi:hypothetical protein